MEQILQMREQSGLPQLSHVTAIETLDAIYATMDGEEWNADLVERIALVLSVAGYVLHDVDTGELDDSPSIDELPHFCEECGTNVIDEHPHERK